MSEGHKEPCYYCGEPCNSLHGNPNLWPIPLCHSDEPGVVKYHHTGCVSERLERLVTLEESLWDVYGLSLDDVASAVKDMQNSSEDCQ
jgi:hypothetical protein